MIIGLLLATAIALVFALFIQPIAKLFGTKLSNEYLLLFGFIVLAVLLLGGI